MKHPEVQGGCVEEEEKCILPRDLSDISTAFSKLSAAASPLRIRPTQLNCIRMLLGCIRERAPNNFRMHSGWVVCHQLQRLQSQAVFNCISRRDTAIVYNWWDLGIRTFLSVASGGQPITFGWLRCNISPPSIAAVVGYVGPSKSARDWCRLI